jgi:threonine dehydratase
VRRTPLAASPWLSDLAAADVALKLEIRPGLERVQSARRFQCGARAAGARRTPRRRRSSTASAGNHGRGLAAAAQTFHLPLIVYTPADAPKTKLAAIERHGATLRAEAPDYDAAEADGEGVRGAQSGAEFISPYSDADVIAGAATGRAGDLRGGAGDGRCCSCRSAAVG